MATPFELSEIWTLRKENLREAQARIIEEIGAFAIKTSKDLLQEQVYEHPIPKSRNFFTGRLRQQWRRTGRLKRNEKLYYKRGGTPAAILRNVTPYAVYRHEMGYPGHRNTRWPAHWRDDTIRKVRAYSRKRWRFELVRAYQTFRG